MNLDLPSLLAQWDGLPASRLPQSPVKLMGFRGALEPAGSPNNDGLTYDDLIARIVGNHLTFWRASTDPSAALIRNPVNPDGAAKLCPGVHLFSVREIHAGTPRQHLALGQAENVHVARLGPDGRQKFVECGDFGIFIHSGGPGTDTGRFSAGCQIIHNSDGYFQDPTWGMFFNPIRVVGGTIPYMLQEISGLRPPRLENDYRP